MVRTFDLVVIGSGSAARSVASPCRAAGWTVAMIDRQPFGGTCALRGCDPKKVLVGAAAAADGARLLAGKGVDAGALRIDWPELMRFKSTFTDPYPGKVLAGLAREGIEAFQASARFVGPAAVAVGDTVLEATRAIVIAAGARPDDLPIAGRERLVSSDRFLELPALPASLVFVGGGYISFEFAHVAARAGAAVTILHRGARPLEEFDPDLVDRLVARSRDLGIRVEVGAEFQAVEPLDGRYRTTFANGPTQAHVDADLVVHGAGRVPDVDDLDLDTGRVARTRDGIGVNAYFQSTSNPRVYAAGDCAATDGPRLTPVAAYEGGIVAENLLRGNHMMPDYTAIPTVAFTVPPLARVGLTEEEGRARGLKFRVHQEDTAAWYSSRRLGESAAASKVLVDETTGQILGAHLLGPNADETINLFALAMRTGVTASRFKEMLWVYPTHASDTRYMI
jgi:glutathione reductase (NADPH)